MSITVRPITVRPIDLPRDAGRFIRSWWPIYEDDPHWVPPLVLERKAFLNPKKNPYFNHADIQCFMAYDGSKPVGTIAACVDHRLQEHEPGTGNLGFFEFVDQTEVAAALLERATGFLREKGMRKAQGPFNFSSNHEFGLLVDGFDTDPVIANPHNRHYYGRVYEEIGLQPAMDWYAYWIDWGDAPERVLRLNDRVLKRYPDIRLRKADMKRFDEEATLLWEIYNDSWSENWGHVHFNRDEFDFTVQGLKQVLNPDLCWFVYMGDELAGAAITLPDYNQVVKPMNGSLFPFGLYHLLTRPRRIDAIRVFVLGIKKDFQHLPLGSPLYVKTWEEAQKLPIRGAECSLVLDTNHRMRGALEKLGGRIYKTYRTYEMDLE